MAGLFSTSTIEQVRAASDIVDVIGAVLPLKRAGANFVALCPFHKERTPSFNVNPQRQIFHCFGCHKGGDVFGFIQEYESLSFVEAVRRLADRSGIVLETSGDGREAESRSVKDTLLEIHEQITQRWQTALAKDAGGEIARAYLARRQVPQEAVELFRLGFAPAAWDDTVNWARSRKLELALVEKAGLIIRKDGPGETRYYDRFRGRLIFPIRDEQGRVIAFSGRVLSGDEKTAKYVNSPETPIFTKSRVFYGLDKSKRAVLDAQFAIVCEGQLDLIACFMAGVQNVVAPQGTAFTGEHARILKRYVDEVVLCFDSDNAGQNAAVRVLDSLVASGLSIRVATMPAPHDPDSFIKEHGGPAFQELIKAAPGFFDYYLDRLCSTNDLSSDRGQVAVTRAMAAALQKTGNRVLMDKYAQKTAVRLGVDAEAVRVEFRRSAGPGPRPEPTPEANRPGTAPRAPASAHELWLLKLVLLAEDQADWLAAHLNLAWVHHPAIRDVLAARLTANAQGTWTGAAALLADLSDPETRSLVSRMLAEARPIPNPQRQLWDVVLRLRNQALDHQITALLAQVRNPALPETEHVHLLQRLQELRRAKTEPLAATAAGDAAAHELPHEAADESRAEPPPERAEDDFVDDCPVEPPPGWTEGSA